ncbi:MAG: phosphotransferase [Chloroflexota bacterium]
MLLSSIDKIDNAVLIPIVQQVLNQHTVKLMGWSYHRVRGGAGDVGDVLSGVYRFTGAAHLYDQLLPCPWSVILKIVGTTGTDDDPSVPRYWKREVLAYQSGQLANLPSGLTSPRFFGIVEFSEKVIGLWLEDLVDDIGPRWPLAQYEVTARHLGQFNGAFLVQNELPSWSWLSRARVAGFRQDAPVGNKFEQLRDSLGDPKARRWFLHDEDMHRMVRLWTERHPLLDALDCLPQTLVHGDAFRRNLFARRTTAGHMQTIAIDWTYIGIEPIGIELASLVQGSLFFSEADITQARQLDQRVFEGYLAGLEDAGWHGDPRQARLGYTAGSAMIFGMGYGAFKLNERVYPWLEQAFGLPIDQFMVLGGELNHFFLELADEAHRLLNIV